MPARNEFPKRSGPPMTALDGNMADASVESLERDYPPSPSDILVVDDDPNNLMAMEVALGDLGGELVKVRSGEKALRELLHRDYAVILLDVQMPNMDGFETARLIRSRERSRHVPIIFVTAYSQNDADMRRGYELGAVDYLFKPIVTEILRAKVQVFIALRQRTDEVARQALKLREMEREEADRRLERERQRWEAEQLRSQNQQLEEADRRKDEFIAILAHELRNPMAPLLNGVELMQLANVTDPHLIKARDVMGRQVRHLARLVDDLLDVSRISQGKLELHREVLAVQSFVDQVVDALKKRFDEENQELIIRAPPHPVHVDVDPVRLSQVLSNLLSNASRYTDAGGKITLEWGTEDGHAIIRVKDTGRGIDPQFQERIFDMFVQERSAGKGLGLGLTLVKQLIELHGGKVRVQSDGRGKGSEFAVQLPLADHQAARPSEESDDSPSSPPLQIAVIEDDDDVRDTMVSLLELWGHRVTVASTGPDGIALVVKMKPDVALLDIGLPGTDGYGVAQAIREQLGESAPRLIAMSGYGQAQDRERSQLAGFHTHLVKPAEPRDLRRALHLGRK